MQVRLSRCPDCDAAFGYSVEFGCPECGYHIRQWNLFKPLMLTRARRERVMERDGYRCVFCGTIGWPNNPLTIDHILPEIDGGDHTLKNLQTACRRCNSRKSDRAIVPSEWHGAGIPVDMSKDPDQRERRRARRDEWASA